jgi:hypothetical protein
LPRLWDLPNWPRTWERFFSLQGECFGLCGYRWLGLGLAVLTIHLIDLLCVLAHIHRGYSPMHRKIHPVRLPHLRGLHVYFPRDCCRNAMRP